MYLLYDNLIMLQVCQNPIDISGKKEQHVVKCNLCNEATPIRNAPPGSFAHAMNNLNLVLLGIDFWLCLTTSIITK